MQFFIVTTIVFILAGANSCFSGEMPEKMKQIVDTCFAKAEVPPAEQQRLLDAKLAVTEGDSSTYCFTKCFMEEWGAMKDGALDEAAVTEMLAPIFGDEKTAEMIEQCKGEQGDAECETEFKIFTCFYNQKPERV